MEAGLIIIVAGVSVVVVSFGGVILFFNSYLLTNLRNVRIAFETAGAISVAVGSQMLIAW